MKYTIIETEGMPSIIQRINADDSVSFIPMDENNSEYQAYLESLEPKTTKVVDEAAPE